MSTTPTIREKFAQAFPNLKWSTTGGTGDIASWFISEFSKLVEEERMVQGKEESDSDWFYGHGNNAALDKLKEKLQ